MADNTTKLHFRCPQCDRPVSVGTQHAGKRAKCPGCRCVVTIPKSGSESCPMRDLKSTPEPSPRLTDDDILAALGAPEPPHARDVVLSPGADVRTLNFDLASVQLDPPGADVRTLNCDLCGKAAIDCVHIPVREFRQAVTRGFDPFIGFEIDMSRAVVLGTLSGMDPK